MFLKDRPGVELCSVSPPDQVPLVSKRAMK